MAGRHRLTTLTIAVVALVTTSTMISPSVTSATEVSGTVLIVEWERGTDVWRETWLQPGEVHVIDLVGPENNALIETFDYSPGFSVSIENCTPQQLPGS